MQSIGKAHSKSGRQQINTKYVSQAYRSSGIQQLRYTVYWVKCRFGIQQSRRSVAQLGKVFQVDLQQVVCTEAYVYSRQPRKTVDPFTPVFCLLNQLTYLLAYFSCRPQVCPDLIAEIPNTYTSPYYVSIPIDFTVIFEDFYPPLRPPLVCTYWQTPFSKLYHNQIFQPYAWSDLPFIGILGFCILYLSCVYFVGIRSEEKTL